MKNLIVSIFLLTFAAASAQPAGYTFTKPVTVESLVEKVKGQFVEANVWKAKDDKGIEYLFTIITNKKGVLARKRIYKK